MRNLTAERKIVERMLALGGLLFVLGLLALLVGAQMWILETLSGSKFWVVEGLWAMAAGVIIATVARITTTSQQQVKPLDSTTLK